METTPETEHDTIAWFRVGLVVTSALVGLALFISGARPASYYFLGYALFGATVMVAFQTWRSSSEVDKVHKSSFKRMVRNIPRGFFRYLMGCVALMIVIVVGLIPAYFSSNESYYEHEQLWNIYIVFLVGVSIVISFWVGGFIKHVRQIFFDFKALREAANRARARRKKEKAKS